MYQYRTTLHSKTIAVLRISNGSHWQDLPNFIQVTLFYLGGHEVLHKIGGHRTFEGYKSIGHDQVHQEKPYL